MPNTHPTYVYVLSNGRGPKKIGASSTPTGRCRAIRAGVAENPLRVAASYFCPLPAREVERQVHARLEGRRLECEREWFDVTVAEARATIEAVISVVEGLRAEADILFADGWSVGRVARRMKVTPKTALIWKNGVAPGPVVHDPITDEVRDV